MRRWGAWLIGALLVNGTSCSKPVEDTPPAPLPQSQLGYAPVNTSTPAGAAASAAAQQTTARTVYPRSPKPTPQQAADPVQPSTVAPEPPDQDTRPNRDLPGELLAHLTGAPACLAARTAEEATSKLRVSVTAHVGPSGRVTRSEATCGQLSTEELQCIRTMIEHARFATPVESAPRSVRASLELHLATPAER